MDNAIASVFDAIPVPILILDDKLRPVRVNDAYVNAIHLTREQIFERTVDDWAKHWGNRKYEVIGTLKDALAGQVTRCDDFPYAVTREDGSVRLRYYSAIQFPYFSEADDRQFVVQMTVDVTEQVKIRQSNEEMSAELKHHSGNLLSVFSAIISLTGNDDTSLEEYRESVQSRVAVLARSHENLTENNWNNQSLRTVLERELAPYKSRARNNISIDGTDIPLRPKTVRNVTMLIHEFASNALKHGCFSAPEGKLSITTGMDADASEIWVRWRETGLSDVSPPSSDGFGFQLARSMPRLRIERKFEPCGLAIEFRVATDLILHPHYSHNASRIDAEAQPGKPRTNI